MTTVEFVEVQKLSPEELRTRFGLPASCDPAVMALATNPAANQISVAIDCRFKPGAIEPTPSSNDRPQPGRRPEKGSQRWGPAPDDSWSRQDPSWDSTVRISGA